MRKVLAKRVLAIALLLCILCLVFGSCSEKSSFSITFIDVGQGDAALVECDGHYMLIDGGGDVSAGKKVKETLKENGVKKLDILVISHLHEDHYGGLAKGLEALQGSKPIGRIISNSTYTDKDTFKTLEKMLKKDFKRKIEIPKCGKTYSLGSATIEVVDATSEEENDSLVLLITYKNARFLFTGDIERKGQLRVIDYLEKQKKDRKDWISLIKMPHHGAYNDKSGLPENALYRLFEQYDPKYFVISVGKGNKYKHPHEDTLQLIKNKAGTKGLYRTDDHGDITVKYENKELVFITEKKQHE